MQLVPLRLGNKQYYILFFIISVALNGSFAQQLKNKDKEIDSIKAFIKYGKDRQRNHEVRKYYTDKAAQLSLLEKNDSLRNIYFLDLSLVYSNLGDSLNFRKFNSKSTFLSKKLKDSISLAGNYWDLAFFYVNKGMKDSAYYNYSNAHKIYNKLEDSSNEAQMLLNMAIIQTNYKDYTGSEITTIEAIKIFKTLNDDYQLYRCYNNLGVIYNGLEEYDQALFYYMEAANYLNKTQGIKKDKVASLNNIGVIYQEKLEYDKAIENFNQALKYENIKKDDPSTFARVLDNLAYSKLKINDTTGIYKLFNDALHIRDSVNNFGGITVNKLHLAEYYLSVGDTLKAIREIKEVDSIATLKENYTDKLTSLKLLSLLEKDYKYGEEYIKLNDSLVKAERTIRNKFARIKFETDEYIEKTEELSHQRKLILIASGIIIILGSLVFIIINQRIKNKKLQLEQDQQKANEEIYNLMLNQQHKVDEGTRKVKKRISEELHDGVLGKLFGTRLILGTLNTSAKKEDMIKREQYIQDLQEIEEEIRNVSHELNDESLKSNVGYITLVETLLNRQSEISRFNYKLINDPGIAWETIAGSLKMNIYRILQEAIQNINKYAQARNVTVAFKQTGQDLELQIEDDGVGFEMSSKSKGIGIKNMRSRTEKIKGTLEIETAINQGTRIIVRAPLAN